MMQQEKKFKSNSEDHNATLKLDELVQLVKENYPNIITEYRTTSYASDKYRIDEIENFASLAYAMVNAGLHAIKKRKLPRDTIGSYCSFFERDIIRRLWENEENLGKNPETHKRNLKQRLYLITHPGEKRTFEACKKVLDYWSRQFEDLHGRIAAIPGEKNSFTEQWS